MAPFYGWGGSTASGLVHFEEAVYFLPLSSQIFLVLSYRPRKDKRLSRPWSHLVVLNMGPLDWKFSTLTTRPSGWVSCGPSLLLLFTLEDLSEHSHIYKRLILHIVQNLLCYLHFAFGLIV